MQEREHDGIQSQGGCRIHVNTEHSSFFYFDEKPNSKEITGSLKEARNFTMENTIQYETGQTTKRGVKLFPSFLVSCDIGEAFTKWWRSKEGKVLQERI